jgi:glutamate/tyrosine decarboxylase-like PLP-dependent enzyme
MTTDDFDRLLEHACRRARAHLDSARHRPPRSQASAAALRAAFKVPLAENGRDPQQVIEALADAAEPGLMGNTGSNFFGWVMGASSPVGMAADLLTAAWGQNAAIYQTSPAAAMAEEAVAQWLLDVLDLPRESSVGFTTGATMASFIGLAAARSEVLRRHGWNVEDEGLAGAPAVNVFVGAEAHTSVLSVLRQLGFGERKLIRIPADAQGRMQAPLLAAALAAVDGPKIVVAQAGHINSGACDPLERIGMLAREHGAWVHVDGAFGLWARTTPVLRGLCAGADAADSWAVDGHKWLQLPYDAGFAIVRHPEAHRRAMGMNASYLNRDAQDGRNPSDWVPELSRRARGFAAWAVMQTLGRTGIREMVERHCACARQLAQHLAGVPGIHVLNEVCLNQLALTFGESTGDIAPADARALTDAVIAEIQRENTSFVSGAEWRGRRIMRVSVIARNTGPRDMANLGDSILRAWQRVSSRECRPASYRVGHRAGTAIRRAGSPTA